MAKILIIDDEKSITTLLREVLTKFGYDVAIAEDGQEGIQKFENGRFDLVITDMLMPRMNGDMVVRHIRKSNRRFTPVIGCSGTPWVLEGCDFDMVLTKPFQLKEIGNAIENLTTGVSTQAPGGGMIHAEN